MVEFAGADTNKIEPILRIAAALGLSEIIAKDSYKNQGEVRRNFNELIPIYQSKNIMTEIIEIQNQCQNGDWQPFVGDETTELLRSKGFANSDRSLNQSGERILDETYQHYAGVWKS
jgi:hypothetical protein